MSKPNDYIGVPEVTVPVDDEDRCACGRLYKEPRPQFDAERAAGMSAREVRIAFPRVRSVCDCGATTIRYASYLHYLTGDW
ncbi:MAG: hypothetical protein ACRCSL_04665 [Microbacterium sp.]